MKKNNQNNKIAINEFFDRYKEKIQEIITNKEQHYRIWFLDKGNGSKRKITEPLAELKFIQNNIKRFLEPMDTSSISYGFRKRRGIRHNAKQHINATSVLNLDIKDFFPSVKTKMVRNIFEGIPTVFNSFNDHIEEAVEMLTYKGELPQGSPASPVVANLAMRKADKQILEIISTQRSCRYTRYADDITISMKKRNDLSEDPTIRSFIKPISSILRDNGFRLNWKKTKTMYPNSQMNITGVVVNSTKSKTCSSIRIPRKYKDKIRAILHNVSQGKPIEEKVEQTLIGMLSHVSNVDKIGYLRLSVDMLKVLMSPYGSQYLRNSLYRMAYPDHRTVLAVTESLRPKDIIKFILISLHKTHDFIAFYRYLNEKFDSSITIFSRKRLDSITPNIKSSSDKNIVTLHILEDIPAWIYGIYAVHFYFVNEPNKITNKRYKEGNYIRADWRNTNISKKIATFLFNLSQKKTVEKKIDITLEKDVVTDNTSTTECPNA